MSDMVRIGAVTLASGENWGHYITNDGTHCYVALDTSPARVVKVRMSDMARIGAVTLISGENWGWDITNDGTHCYVALYTSPARVVKVRMSDMVRIGAVTLASGEDWSWAITNDGTHCYVAHYTSPARVVKVRMSDMARIGAVTLASGEDGARDITNDGTHCYVALDTSPARVVKVRMSDMVRIGAVTLASGEDGSWATITNDGTHCYVAHYTFPARVVKVDMGQDRLVVTVKSARYKIGIPGVIVTVDGVGSAETDNSGQVTFYGLPLGQKYNYRVNKEGYTPVFGSETLTETNAGIIIYLEFAEQPFVGYPPGTRIKLQFRVGDSVPYPMGAYFVDRNDSQTGAATIKINGRNAIGKYLRDQSLDEKYEFAPGVPLARFSDMLTAAGMVKFVVATGGNFADEMVLTPDKTYLDAINEMLKLLPGWVIVENQSGTVIIAPTDDVNMEQPGTHLFYRHRDLFSVAVTKDDWKVYTRVCAHTADFSLKAYRSVLSSLTWSPPAPKTYYGPVPDEVTEAEAGAYADYLAELCRDSGEVEEFVGPFRPQVMPGDTAEIAEEIGSRKVGTVTTVIHRFGKQGFLTLLTVDSGGRVAKARFSDFLQMSR